VDALVYRMTATHLAPPEPDYLATLLRGYRDFGIAMDAAMGPGGTGS
jgi:hypothetical protein